MLIHAPANACPRLHVGGLPTSVTPKKNSGLGQDRLQRCVSCDLNLNCLGCGRFRWLEDNLKTLYQAKPNVWNNCKLNSLFISLWRNRIPSLPWHSQSGAVTFVLGLHRGDLRWCSEVKQPLPCSVISSYFHCLSWERRKIQYQRVPPHIQSTFCKGQVTSQEILTRTSLQSSLIAGKSRAIKSLALSETMASKISVTWSNESCLKPLTRANFSKFPFTPKPHP